MQTLYLCEKPSQAKDIAAVLNAQSRKDGYFENQEIVVTWCVGHLLEMANPDEYDAKYKKWSFDTLPILPDQWRMSITKSGGRQFKVIKQLLKSARHVVISTDADREGETIAREILDLCNFRGAVERLWLSALDPASIRKALSNILPDEKTKPLYFAGLGRGRADWLIGMNLTRAYTLLSKQAGGDKVVSVGRVQTPTLNLIVERDLAIESFRPVPFYDIHIDCDASGAIYKAKWIADRSPDVATDTEGRCLDKAQASAVAQCVNNKSGVISEFTQSIKDEPHPLPFDLSSLQIEASKRFGIDADAVLKAAQSLYETHKATTYPRTDCRYLPVSQFADVHGIIEAIKQSDPDWCKHSRIHLANLNIKSRCWNDSKITAHHAIIPTSANFDVQKLSEIELKIYELIRQNYTLQFFNPYRYEAIKCVTQVDQHFFLSHGRVDIDPGWRVMLTNVPRENNEEQDLPSGLYQGMSIHVLECHLENKETKPPARFTSGTIIAAMKNAGKYVENSDLRKVLKETAGIGTEATRASIIDTLLTRSYIKKSGKYLVSTEFGRELIKSVPDVLKDPATTALWEQFLDDIANGKNTLNTFMAKQNQFITQMIDYLSQQYVSNNYGPIQQPSTKPQAEKKIASRKQLVVGESCPQCSAGKLILKTIKTGKNAGKEFIGCNKYPKCNTFAWSNPT